jgi:hypothetical protein
MRRGRWDITLNSTSVMKTSLSLTCVSSHVFLFFFLNVNFLLPSIGKFHVYNLPVLAVFLQTQNIKHILHQSVCHLHIWSFFNIPQTKKRYGRVLKHFRKKKVHTFVSLAPNGFVIMTNGCRKILICFRRLFFFQATGFLKGQEPSRFTENTKLHLTPNLILSYQREKD